MIRHSYVKTEENDKIDRTDWNADHDDLSSVKYFGAVGDGETNDTVAIVDAINTLKGSETIYFPSGTYLVDSISISMTGNINIVMDPNAEITTQEEFTNPIFTFTGTQDTYNFSLKGGKINCSNITHSTDKTRNALNIHKAGKITIEDVIFLHNKDYIPPSSTGQYGDSSILVSTCYATTIKNCKFIGAPDYGIEVYGQHLLTNDIVSDIVIKNNFFDYCQNGISLKGLSHQVIVAENIFKGCYAGIITEEVEVELSLLEPADSLIITNNQFKNSALKAVEMRLSNYSIITNNRIEDYGKDKDGVDIANPRGIEIIGSKECIVSNNWIGFVDYVSDLPADTNGIFIGSYTYDETPYHSTHVKVTDNIITYASYGIVEDTSDVGPNTIYNNSIHNSITGDLSLVNTSTTRQELFGTTAPATGSWRQGDIVWNNDAAATEYVGWICVTAGSPGTWKGFGAIES